MNMKKRGLSLLLTLALLLGLCSPAGGLVPTAEAAVFASGDLEDIGNGAISWTRDNDRVLTLTGTGAIPDEPTWAGVCPFHYASDELDSMYNMKKIVIGETNY